MQELSVKLFEGAYIPNPRTERRMMLLAGAATALQVVLLLYLVISKTFAAEMLFIFLFNLFIPAYFIFSAWLDRKPHYRRHLTLSPEGVRYRTRFMRPEQEFDWAEVDTVDLQHFKVVFVLKNEEVHEISLEHIQNDEVLRQVKEQIRELAHLKEVELC